MTINLSPKQQADLHSRLHNTFKTYLCNYEEDWLYHILPSIVVAGGAVPAMLQGEQPNDFDVYFTNEDSFRKAFRYVSNKIEVNNDLEIKGLKLGKLRKNHFGIDVVKTENAITFPNKVQVITRFIGDPLTLFETFDFEHCKCYWKPSIREKNSGTLHFEGQSLESLLKKQLIYTGKSRFVLSAMKRHEKFVSRGWKTNNLTRLKLMSNSSKLDWGNPEVIMEQLQGYYGEDRKECEEFLKQFQNH